MDRKRKYLWLLIGLIALILSPAIMVASDVEVHKPEGTRGHEMVLVPAGKFMMGCNRRRDRHCDADENPYHSVVLDAFYIDRYEVTNALYRECANTKVCRTARSYSAFDGDDQPAVGVSWDDAVKYCKWAGKSLPTEAQWEKAARGTQGRVYPWGNSSCGCDCAIQEARQLYGCEKDATWPVGSAEKGASPYGALDMSGNVWEWVADWYDEKYYKASPEKNPKGPEAGTEKVKRGGCYANIKNYLRTSDRSPSNPESISNSTGFRCVAPAPEIEAKDQK